MHEALSLLRYTASGNSPQLCLEKIDCCGGAIYALERKNVQFLFPSTLHTGLFRKT